MRFPALATFACLVGLAAAPQETETVAVDPCLQQPVKPPAFLQGMTFHVMEVSNPTEPSAVRTANAYNSPVPAWANPPWNSPGVRFNRDFSATQLTWQRDPHSIVRDALTESFASVGVSAGADTADYLVSVNLSRFGLVEATWREYYSKLEMTVTLTNRRTGAVTSVAALGSSSVNKETHAAQRAQSIQTGLETALRRGVTNFLYNARLKAALE